MLEGVEGTRLSTILLSKKHKWTELDGNSRGWLRKCYYSDTHQLLCLKGNLFYLFSSVSWLFQVSWKSKTINLVFIPSLSPSPAPHPIIPLALSMEKAGWLPWSLYWFRHAFAECLILITDTEWGLSEIIGWIKLKKKIVRKENSLGSF